MELAPRSLDDPSLARLPRDAVKRELILAYHREALAADDDGYDDPVTGLFVFTSAYLATRDCCEMGCRHCPYVE